MNEYITWSEYVEQRCKKLFNTDDLNDDRVLEFVIQSVKKDGRAVYIEEDTLIGTNSWNVFVVDEENKSWHFAFLLVKTRKNVLNGQRKMT